MNRTSAAPTEIRFVYFDLGNVLVAFDPAIACANVARLFGVRPADARRVIYDSGLQTSFEYGRVSSERYAMEIRRGLSAEGQQHCVDAVETDAILDAVSAMFTPVESMTPMIERVRAGGLPIGVLSNTCVAHWQWIVRQAYPVMQIPYDAIVLSCEVGSMKPDDAIYEQAERAATVAPTQILFLDDRIENVEAARHRGWQAEQCLGAERAEAVLVRHGLIDLEQTG